MAIKQSNNHPAGFMCLGVWLMEVREVDSSERVSELALIRGQSNEPSGRKSLHAINFSIILGLGSFCAFW